MDDELLVMRLKELRVQLADIDRRLKALDGILADGATDEAIKKYADELLKIAEDKDTIINEARMLILMAEQRPSGNEGVVN
jgi:hypothetical protein